MDNVVVALFDSGVMAWNLEDSFSNELETMDFNAYPIGCDSPCTSSDHNFLSSVLPPFGIEFGHCSSFEGIKEEILRDSQNCLRNCDDVGCSILKDKIVSQPEVDFDDDDHEIGVIETREKSLCQHNEKCNVVKSVIPRPLKYSLSEKMLHSLQLLKEWSGEGILAQVWVPIKNGDNQILSTCEQPFLLDQTLSGYREVSRLYNFTAESKPGSFLGLPGRVFTSKIPEWTSNVLYYKEAEYLRIQYAIDHKVKGSIALPV